jgi:hypothetical protein
VYRLILLLPLLVLLAACGGGGGSSTNRGGGGGSGGGSGGSGSQPGQSVPVLVSASQAQTGIDINVPAPASNPAPNASVIGVAFGSGTVNAFNTGVQISRSQHTSGLVFLCGPGLPTGTGAASATGWQVKISGPSDITVNTGSIQATQCTDSSNNKINGIQFTVGLTATTALGGRTVLLISPQSDIDTFTGGLEVVQ